MKSSPAGGSGGRDNKAGSATVGVGLLAPGDQYCGRFNGAERGGALTHTPLYGGRVAEAPHLREAKKGITRGFVFECLDAFCLSGRIAT